MSLNKKINISIFFPCYNEEKNIEVLTNSATNFIQTISDQYEVIIVNDGSKDSTREIAETIAKRDPHVKVYNHETNYGYGAALKTGFKNSIYDYIFFTDGDNQFDIKEIGGLLPYAEEFDIVAGYRINRRDNFMRRLNAWSFNLFVRILFGLKIRGPTELKYRLSSNSCDFCSERSPSAIRKTQLDSGNLFSLRFCYTAR